jgi:hypothetical protein
MPYCHPGGVHLNTSSGRDKQTELRREPRRTVCARVARQTLAGGRATSPLGRTIMGTDRVAPHYTGSCLCGGVRFELTAELGPIEVCYCQMCRKASGGPLATNSSITASRFRITSGTGLIRGYESSPGETRHFCGRCGSPIYSAHVDRPQVVRLRVGTISGPLNVRPSASYYTASKCNWWEILDALPRFERE